MPVDEQAPLGLAPDHPASPISPHDAREPAELSRDALCLQGLDALTEFFQMLIAALEAQLAAPPPPLGLLARLRRLVTGQSVAATARRTMCGMLRLCLGAMAARLRVGVLAELAANAAERAPNHSPGKGDELSGDELSGDECDRDEVDLLGPTPGDEKSWPARPREIAGAAAETDDAPGRVFRGPASQGRRAASPEIFDRATAQSETAPARLPCGETRAANALPAADEDAPLRRDPSTVSCELPVEGSIQRNACQDGVSTASAAYTPVVWFGATPPQRRPRWQEARGPDRVRDRAFSGDETRMAPARLYRCDIASLSCKATAGPDFLAIAA